MTRLRELADASAKAQHEASLAQEAFTEAEATRSRAQAEVDRVVEMVAEQTGEVAVAQELIDDYARASYMSGPTELTNMASLLDATSPTDFADRQVKIEAVANYQTGVLVAAVEKLDQYKTMEVKARGILAEAETALAKASARVQAAQKKVAATSAAFADELANVNAQYEQVNAAMQQRNADTAQSWADYVARLAKVKAAPLPASSVQFKAEAKALANLPEGYSPVPTKVEGFVEPGVAIWGKGRKTTEVVPQEAVSAVTTAVGALGSGYVWESPDPALYDCSNLLSRAYKPSGIRLPKTLNGVAKAYPRVRLKNVRPGDIILMSDTFNGIYYAGIATGEGRMIAASAATGLVTAQDIPTEGVWGAVRPTLPRVKPYNEVPAPDADAAGVELRCDAPLITINTTGQGAWGGWANGLIPLSAMCPLAGNQGHYFRCDAAKAWEALDRAYRKEFGRPLCLTDSYRQYDVQVRLFEIGQSHANPGTSNHGWGLATDLCVYGLGGEKQGIGFGSPDYAWLRENAPRYGWIHPMWAREGQPLQEPWHWQFGIDDSSQPYTP